MWKIFFTQEDNQWLVLQSLEDWKLDIFKNLEIELKKYFAKKVVIYFDNMAIFHQKRGIHANLMESLSLAEKEMQSATTLFPKVVIYIVKEENGCVLITQGLSDNYIKTLKSYDFELLENNANLTNEKETKLYNMAWSTLVFDAELINFAQSWIDYTPNLNERSILQAEYILMNVNFKKNNSSLLEKVIFKENINTSPQYEELYQKVMRIMPKIEESLEKEWRTTAIETKIEENMGKIKKTGSGTKH